MRAQGFIESVGRGALHAWREMGGITILSARVLRALVPPTMDGRELIRHMYRMGNRSLPIIALTAFLRAASWSSRPA